MVSVPYSRPFTMVTGTMVTGNVMEEMERVSLLMGTGVSFSLTLSQAEKTVVILGNDFRLCFIL